ncbi:trehalose operon repressor [Rothia nasimurium]|uniref:Trehalose operon repressor n=1 Tax=Rothia nasimurium TaxID=85336 RepID=A0A4Y9F307_9MICC|nr:trehalose operon repressor [Rothia nasimurium]MBF0808438.1 trehalose operon repressor [Rothia nasimurium]TFU22050.1 trehalose operon repressor [Rothia nasimurium]
MGKFERIYHDLARDIDEGKYGVGDLLPSEKKLTEKYNVSRETARKALAILTDRGYIQRIMGKGSLVIDHKRYSIPVSSLVSYKEFAESASRDTQTELVELEDTLLPHVPFQALTDGSVEQVPVTHIMRVRHMDGAPAIIDHDYIIKSVVPEIPREVAEDSLYHYFEGELGLSIVSSAKQITIEQATPNDAKYLNLHAGEYVAVTTSITVLEDGTAFQYTISRHRADKFRYLDFAHRRQEIPVSE